MPDLKNKAIAIKEKYGNAWLRLNGVTAIGIGQVNSGVGIIISVESNENKIRAQIPNELEGVPIKIEFTGIIQAL